MSIEESPMNRSCPSDIWMMRRNVSRQRLGARNGSTPSMMSIRAIAMSKVVAMAHLRCAGALPAASFK